MRGTISMVAAVLALAFLPPAAAGAQPVGDVESESPFIDQFFQDIEDDGFGYLDPAWKVSDAAWMGCGMLEVPGSDRDDAVNVVAGRGYSPAEATSILDAATTRLCN
jgi:hypothetical protein